VVHAVGMGVRADVHVVDKDLPFPDNGITVFHVRLSLPQGFDLRPQENKSRLKGLFDKVVDPRRFVLGDYFFTRLLFHHDFPRLQLGLLVQ